MRRKTARAALVLAVAVILALAVSATALAAGNVKTVKNIAIFGISGISTDEVLFHLGVKPGDVYDPFKLATGMTWLRHSGLFSSVEYEVFDEGDTVSVNLYLNENIGLSKSGGNSVFGAVTREEVYGFFDLDVPIPISGLGFSPALGLNYSKQSWKISPKIQGVALFGHPLGWSLRATYISKTTDELSNEPERTFGAELKFKQALLPNVSWMTGLDYQHESRLTTSAGNDYLAVTGRLQFDVNPALLWAEAETGYSWGDYDNGLYFKTAGKAELPVRLNDRFFLLGEAQAGWASDNTPYRALYDVGGSSGLRGYHLQEADRYAVGSLGLYWQTFSWLQSYTFCDVGVLRDGPSDTWSSTLYSVGLGLRFNLMGLYGVYKGNDGFGWGLSIESAF